MKAIILAAGEGIRMRPLTLARPKPLLTVCGKPLLEHLVSKFPEEISELIVVVGYLGDQIEAYCGKKFFGRPVVYVRQAKKSGTFDALELCRLHLKEDESFAVFYADDLLDRKTIEELVKPDLAVICKAVPNPERFGVAILDKNGFIAEIIEKPDKPASNLAVASGAKLGIEIFDYRPARRPSGELYLSEAIGEMAKNRKIKAVEAGFWLPLATPADLEKAERNFGKF